jgi:deoxycytidylate deaminase
MAKPGNELGIGMVGALGTDLEMVQGLIERALNEVGYQSKSVRLSQLMKEIPGFDYKSECSSEQFDVQVEALMDTGNEIRAVLGGDAIAKLAVMKIRDIRDEAHGKTSNRDSSKPLPRTAYLLRSLKHPDEVAFLREIYGDSFFLFSAYCPKKQRTVNLAHKIRKSHHKHRQDEFEPDAIRLLQKDEEESDNKMGQHVRKTFWKGDAFINASSKDDAEHDIVRVIKLWFGHPYITPTRDEFSMFCARASAFRSASMGRQVGAAISDPEGAVLATGTNEIPKSGGGHYWEGDEPDGRDHKRQHDSSDTMRRELLEDALSRLQESGWRPPVELEGAGFSKLATELLMNPKMEAAEFQSLTEYQRPVHAEMSAITDAARRGVQLKGMTLYCTAFPCHGCARHIVSSGIRRVVYIEPYAKSLVKTLYDDSIAVDEWCESELRVRFEPFIGVAPRRYLDLFVMGIRKDKYGKTLEWKPADTFPRIGGWEDWLSVEKENRNLDSIRLELETAKEKWENAKRNEQPECKTNAGMAGATD